MQNHLFRRGTGLALALAAALSLSPMARAAELIQLKGTDALLPQGTEYTYTGQPIEPEVTVTVENTRLEEDTHYTLTYADNIAVGTGTATVTGIPEAGYQGTIDLPFTIAKTPGTPEFTLVEITESHVALSGTEFPYTGQPIEPEVTVTIEDRKLTQDKDFTVTYENNLAPGTGTATIRGIATAGMDRGYYGNVTLEFTITETVPELPTEPEKPTEPETPTEPEKPTQPEEEEPFDYKITRGSGSKWRQDSGKHLTFTVNADTDKITALRIDGKKLDKTHYTLGKNGAVVLKNSWLEDQAIGTYRITLEFEDGKAEGRFTVTAPADPTNPQTGDAIGLWAGAMVCSCLAATVLILLRKRGI